MALLIYYIIDEVCQYINSYKHKKVILHFKYCYFVSCRASMTGLETGCQKI